MRANVSLVLTLLFPASRAAAQAYAMDHGVWKVAGSASFSHTSDDIFGGTTTIAFSPTVGYFVLPGLVIGARGQVSHFSREGTSSTFYSVGPAVSYYFFRGPTKVHPFLSVSALYTHVAGIFGSTGSNGILWDGSGGAAVLLARNVALTGELYYSHTSPVSDNPMRSRSEYGTRFGIAVFLW